MILFYADIFKLFIPYPINIYIILWCQISHLFFANSIYKCIVISILFAICHTETISAVCLKYSTCNSFLVFQFSTPLYGWEVSCSSIQFFFESFSFHLSSQLLCATNAGSRGQRKKKFAFLQLPPIAAVKMGDTILHTGILCHTLFCLWFVISRWVCTIKCRIRADI